MAGATYAETLDAFTNFLTAYVHTLLYLRSLYPRTSFVHSRFHNTSAYQSRHPLVCNWIRDAIDAVKTELLNGTVARIGIVIFHYGDGGKTGRRSAEGKGNGDVQILERFMIDVSAFPMVDKDDRNAIVEWGYRPPSQVSSRSGSHIFDDEYISADGGESGCDDSNEGLSGADTPSRLNRSREGSEPNEPDFDIGVDTNLAEQMRAALISLATRCAQLKSLPDKCSFNVAMELRDEADVDPPIGHPQAWIPVQPSLQKTGRKAMGRRKIGDGEGDGSTQEGSELGQETNTGEDLGGFRFIPIRTVESGTFRFETWVEEGRAKFTAPEDQAPESSKMGFGKTVFPASSNERSKASFSTSSGDSITK